jgi:hypothetical protein
VYIREMNVTELNYVLTRDNLKLATMKATLIAITNKKTRKWWWWWWW